jgi:predicted permease
MMFLGDGPPPPSEERKPGCVISVSSDYFHAIGTAMLMGRGFSDDDNAASARVAIVNQAFAKEYFQGDALGKRLNTNIQSKDAAHDFSGRTIVGIAQDVRYNGLERDVAPIIYLPMNQVPQWRMNLVLRTANAPSSLPSAVRHAVAGVDPNQPVFDFETMEMRISDAVAQRRFIMLLIACFALLAVLLSAVGVYGVFAYSVSQRRQEMGIRLALGATRGSVLRMVVAHAGRLIALGGVMGAGTALLANKLLASMLVGVSSHDAFTLASALVLMTMVAGVASLLPAAQAARTNLCSVLRTE